MPILTTSHGQLGAIPAETKIGVAEMQLQTGRSICWCMFTYNIQILNSNAFQHLISNRYDDRQTCVQ